MNVANALTVAMVVASTVIPYLISQQDVAIPPWAKVALTALNIGLVAWARFSNPKAVPMAVEITSPVAIEPAGPEPPDPTGEDS